MDTRRAGILFAGQMGAVMEVLHAESREPRIVPRPLLRGYVRAGRLGRKAGRGMYEYPC